MADSITSTLGGAFGGVPAPVDPQGAQSAAIGGNLSNLSNLYALATGMGTASGAGASANLNTALPGATAGLGSELGLATGELSGMVDQPTINNLEQVAAERGVSTGNIGSPNSNAALMQALGRTTQGTEQLGVQNLTSAISSAPVGPQFDPSTQQVTPGQQISAEQVNSSNAALPNPSAVAGANMSALQAGLLAGKKPTVGTASGGLPVGLSIGAGGGASTGRTAASPSNPFPGEDNGRSIAYGPGGGPTGTGTTGFSPNTTGYGSGFSPAATGYAATQPGGGTAGGGAMDGATAYQQAYGQQLPPGTTYDQQTGMVMDMNNGTATDPNTGLVFDAYTGDVVSSDDQQGEPQAVGAGGQGTDYFDEGGYSDSGGDSGE